ncbi:hypothetical protein [Methylobacterium sp. A54F]
MADRDHDDAPRGIRPDSPAIHRLGHHAIGLLTAARELGDPELTKLAEATMLAAGFVLARSLAPSPGEGRTGGRRRSGPERA